MNMLIYHGPNLKIFNLVFCICLVRTFSSCDPLYLCLGFPGTCWVSLSCLCLGVLDVQGIGPYFGFSTAYTKILFWGCPCRSMAPLWFTSDLPGDFLPHSIQDNSSSGRVYLVFFHQTMFWFLRSFLVLIHGACSSCMSLPK